jgi:hypothetical protein
MADHNIEGQFDDLLTWIQESIWQEVWAGLDIKVEQFATVGLAGTDSDLVVWRTCQERGILLFTANRNQDGDDSLEATIRRENTPTSLPVFTLANVRRFERSRGYVQRVAVRLMEYLMDIDAVRGAGRIYLP